MVLLKSVAIVVVVLGKQLISTVELLYHFIALLLAHCAVKVMFISLQYIGMLDIYKRCCIARAKKSPRSLSPLG